MFLLNIIQTLSVESRKIPTLCDLNMNTIQQRLRRRDRLCQILGRSLLHSTSSPTLSHSAPTHTPAKTPQNARIRSSILADTLETLDPGERETICGCLPENGVNIDEAFVSAHSHATELQRLCTSKRWTWRYNGREIVLADKMSKVMQLLDKFKSIGDVIASVDPMHIGLPWAGFRAIIQVSTRPRLQLIC